MLYLLVNLAGLFVGFGLHLDSCCSNASLCLTVHPVQVILDNVDELVEWVVPFESVHIKHPLVVHLRTCWVDYICILVDNILCEG